MTEKGKCTDNANTESLAGNCERRRVATDELSCWSGQNMGPQSSCTLGWQKVPIREASWIAFMHIIKENLKEADCILIQQIVQARAVKKERETTNYATSVVEERRKKMMKQHARQIEGWLEHTDSGTRTIPKWSEVFDGEEQAQELVRKSLLGCAGLGTPNVPLIKSPLAEPPRAAHEGRVGALSRRTKGWSQEAQVIAELDVLEDLPKEIQWSNWIREDILRVVAFSERETGPKRFEQVTGGPEGDAQVRFVSQGEQSSFARDETMEAEELEKAKDLEHLRGENLEIRCREKSCSGRSCR